MRIGSNNRRHNPRNAVVGVLERPAIATGAETTPNLDLPDATNLISHQICTLKTQPATLTTAACSQPTPAPPLFSRNDAAMPHLCSPCLTGHAPGLGGECARHPDLASSEREEPAVRKGRQRDRAAVAQVSGGTRNNDATTGNNGSGTRS
uniref:Uncharacterized protein n=1 Tax=Phyllostachys edulis TaxID=38705 RepID=D3IVD0_PHYED|nr:hypothetical protein [Phyllostachys edulis]